MYKSCQMWGFSAFILFYLILNQIYLDFGPFVKQNKALKILPWALGNSDGHFFTIFLKFQFSQFSFETILDDFGNCSVVF